MVLKSSQQHLVISEKWGGCPSKCLCLIKKRKVVKIKLRPYFDKPCVLLSFGMPKFTNKQTVR